VSFVSNVRFSVIGIDHDHIYGQTNVMLDAGAELVAFHGPDETLAAAYARRFPQARRVADPREILEDPSIQLIVSAGVNSDRAGTGIAAMRHGKDYMSDKPGLVSLEQLADVRRVQAETKRIYSICYSEHYLTRSTTRAGDLVRAGAIGEVHNTVGLGPHRIRKPIRPDWFFQRARYGGILTDIASHQAEQFLFFTGETEAHVASACVANRANADRPELQDFGDIHLRGKRATGYIRVDWFTPDGLPTWGDGRLFLMGTEGTIELRKYIDIAGREGTDHLFLSDRQGVRHIDCSDTALVYGRDLVHDILHRTETCMTQEHCFRTMELALQAQALAERGA
jgi:predicted dehydrogenase